MEPEENALTKAGQNSFKNHFKRTSSSSYLQCSHTKIPDFPHSIVCQYKNIEPLVFIHQYLQHVPPPYFQKVRYYGIHSSASQAKIRKEIPQMMRNHGSTIRTVMEIITQLLKIPKLQCDRCGHDQFEIEDLRPYKEYIKKYISVPDNRSP